MLVLSKKLIFSRKKLATFKLVRAPTNCLGTILNENSITNNITNCYLWSRKRSQIAVPNRSETICDRSEKERSQIVSERFGTIRNAFLWKISLAERIGTVRNVFLLTISPNFTRGTHWNVFFLKILQILDCLHYFRSSIINFFAIYVFYVLLLAFQKMAHKSKATPLSLEGIGDGAVQFFIICCQSIRSSGI